MRKIFLILGMCFALLGSAYAQQKVTGTVTDEDGVGIPGASIVQKGTGNGTISNIDGEYTITVPGDAVLVFSFVGMATIEEPVDNRSEINVSLLTDAVGLDEVVVTALGIKRDAKKLGYAVTKVDGGELALSSTISPIASLQGKTAGVHIASNSGGVFAGSRITIRGNSTLGGNNQPIYVVDGVIFDNANSGGDGMGYGYNAGNEWGNELKNLNPDDFEEVSVLRGAAATALYGNRALNGVVLITTKKGRQKKGLGVEVSQRMFFSDAYDGPAFQNVYGSGIPGWDTQLTDRYNGDQFYLDDEGNPSLIPVIGGVHSFGKKFDGSKVIGMNGEMINYNPIPNNFLDAFETGMQNNTNVALTGAGENSSFRLSYTYADNQGVTPENRSIRHSISSNIHKGLTDALSVDFIFSYSGSKSYNPPANDLIWNYIYNYFPRDYDAAFWQDNYMAPHGGIHGNRGGADKDQYSYMPGHGMWFSLYENENLRQEETYVINPTVTYQIAPGISVKANMSLHNYILKEEVKNPGNGYANDGGFYKLGHTRKTQEQARVMLNINKDLMSGDLNVNFTGGYELFHTQRSNNWAQTRDGLKVPLQYFLGNSKGTQRIGKEFGGGVGSEYMNVSAMGFVNLAYKNFLFLDVTGRNDWTSTMVFADGTGNYSFFYPSATLSYIFTDTFEESLPSWMNFGKLRAAFAQVGNGAGAYSLNTPFTYKVGDITTADGKINTLRFANQVMPSKELEPEKKNEIEFGLDVRMFDSRLEVDATYYKNNTKNQIIDLDVPSYTGVTKRKINAGDIQNQGIELALKTTPVKTGDLRWDVDFTYTRNRNKIVDLHPDYIRKTLYGSAGWGNTRVESQAVVGGAYGLLITDSKPAQFVDPINADNPNNGKYLAKWHSTSRSVANWPNGKRQIVGDMNPDFLGSINTTLTYKNFRLNALFDAKIGGDFVTRTGYYGLYSGVLESSLKYRDAEHGGMAWTTNWDVGANRIVNEEGNVEYVTVAHTPATSSYNDGLIPDVVFYPGTAIDMEDAQGNVYKTYPGGMSYLDAYNAGLVDPSHASGWYVNNNMWPHPASWRQRAISPAMVQENSYVMFRELSLTYTVPSNFVERLGVESCNVSLIARDLGFVYKTLDDNINPESNNSTESGAAHETNTMPFVRKIGFALNIGF